MRNPEISAGIKNAMQRGDSIENAKQSFLNAGYSKQDIEDSAKDLGGVISQIPEKKEEEKIAEQGKTEIPKKKGVSKKVIILLIILLIVLGGGLATTFLFQEEIIDFISKIF